MVIEAFIGNIVSQDYSQGTSNKTRELPKSDTVETGIINCIGIYV